MRCGGPAEEIDEHRFPGAALVPQQCDGLPLSKGHHDLPDGGAHGNGSVVEPGTDPVDQRIDAPVSLSLHNHDERHSQKQAYRADEELPAAEVAGHQDQSLPAAQGTFNHGGVSDVDPGFQLGSGGRSGPQHLRDRDAVRHVRSAGDCLPLSLRFFRERVADILQRHPLPDGGQREDTEAEDRTGLRCRVEGEQAGDPVQEEEKVILDALFHGRCQNLKKSDGNSNFTANPRHEKTPPARGHGRGFPRSDCSPYLVIPTRSQFSSCNSLRCVE